MDVIPVIDIKDGVVVHARRGERHAYQPIETPLSPTSDPVDVAHGLLSVFPFRHLYVADLDAIAGAAPDARTIERIASAAPGVAVWVDNGIAAARDLDGWLAQRPGMLVLGSESQDGTETLKRYAGDERVVLSLDYRGEAFQGPAAIEHDATLWPSRVIVMTLARVGAGAGPDLERIAAVRDGAGTRGVYAAGGVRNANDLAALAQAGAAGVLVASALHAGSLSRGELERFARV